MSPSASRWICGPPADLPLSDDGRPLTQRNRPVAPRLLVLFVDGVGIGEPDPTVNPFFLASVPVLTEILGGELPTLDAPAHEGSLGRSFPLDACLGVPGTPQSGTGQVTILTGRNGPELFGRHFGPWPPVRLRPILDEENFLRRATELGARAAFANAYPRGYPAGLPARRVAAPPLAAHSAGLLNRDHEALAEGRAVASEIVNDGWRRVLGFSNLPSVSAANAGKNLAGIAALVDLTLFAHYQTDMAGHRGGMEGAVGALERLDRFLEGLLEGLPDDLLVLIVSDHGNLEDVRVGHTRNPALGILLGASARSTPVPTTLLDIAGFVMDGVAARLGPPEARDP
ncbi:MAG: alkaline phosphatase family protein [Gemmatimonadota bacterium]